MAYKDKDKQKEANKEQMRRARAKGNTIQGNTIQGNTESPRVTDQDFTRLLAADVGAPIVRVSKPGDADYVPMCETTRAFIEGRDKRPETGKRGKDIKCFEDLPPDVQETIHKLSTIDGKVDQTSKANRTAIAVNYQHLFPGRYNSTGVA